MSDSLLGTIREIASQESNNIVACTVVKTNPLQLKIKDKSGAIITQKSLIIPSHVTLSVGNTAFITPYAQNTYFVLGRK